MLSVLGLAKDDPVWAGTTPADDLAPIVDGLVRALLDQRQAARARRDFAAADQIRDQLGALGLTVEDTAQGPRWTRSTGRTGDKSARD
jgi:cysteinyl-tRNA synthetase